MGKVLIVVDMQNDFVSGSLGSDMAQAIVPNVLAKIEEYKKQGYQSRRKAPAFRHGDIRRTLFLRNVSV